ncbi:major facilitator superfamily transporter [Pseudomassariella vexata]|uniref:Major facilitator superfamily transporter n=1 Tax=Pseudomassariella vexata TaxID=1141098 RepID=A0A1Y2EIT1_9PEZI|nr:major facilitator superfamily transporter [Pseudomassariella vexata]ORY71488.1 major facilitator superfamily transporter [Pseudomassariella vexata]
MATTKSPPSSVDQPNLKHADEAQRPGKEEWKPTTHVKLIIYTLAVTSLIVSLDASVITTSLSAIIQDLDGDSTQAFWIGTSYLLVNAVTMPFICSVSDIFGRPICFEFALVMFFIGTVICCTANDVAQMLAGRCVQGVGGAGIHALGLVIMTDIVPLRFRPKWYGVTLAGWAVGLSLGPILGGAIVQHTTWRWIFYMMFPITAYGIVIVPYLLTIKPRTSTLRQKLARVDWIGGVLFTSSATSLLIGVSWAGVQFAWNSAQTIVPLVAGIVGIAATIMYENEFAREPFLRRSLFGDMSSTVTYVGGCAQGLTCYAWLYYLTFYFMSVLEFTPIDAGVAMLASCLSITLAGIISGRVVTRFNNYRWAICIGWLLASLGAGLTLEWQNNNHKAVWIVTQLILGFGQGAVLNAQNFACQAMCKPGEEGVAAAMYVFVRQFGFALGVSIGGTTFQNVMALKLGRLGLPVELAKQAEGYIDTLVAMPPSEEKNKIVDSYTFGFMGCYEVLLGVSVVALILSVLFVKQCDMNKDLDTEHKLHPHRMIDVFRGEQALEGKGVRPEESTEAHRGVGEEQREERHVSREQRGMRRTTTQPDRVFDGTEKTTNVILAEIMKDTNAGHDHGRI